MLRLLVASIYRHYHPVIDNKSLEISIDGPTPRLTDPTMASFVKIDNKEVDIECLTKSDKKETEEAQYRELQTQEMSAHQISEMAHHLGSPIHSKRLVTPASKINEEIATAHNGGQMTYSEKRFTHE